MAYDETREITISFPFMARSKNKRDFHKMVAEKTLEAMSDWLFIGEVQIEIEVSTQENKRRLRGDMDNYIKNILDALKDGIAFVDDWQVQAVTCLWTSIMPGFPEDFEVRIQGRGWVERDYEIVNICGRKYPLSRSLSSSPEARQIFINALKNLIQQQDKLRRRLKAAGLLEDEIYLRTKCFEPIIAPLPPRVVKREM